MKKKFVIILIWLIILNILINICYYLVNEDGIHIILQKVSFKVRYFFRETIEQEINYSNYIKNNVISKNNLCIKLSNINYKESSGELKLGFNFYTDDNQTLEYFGSVIRIYDDSKIFYHNLLGSTVFFDNTNYLLYNTNLYGEINPSDLYNKKLYGQLDDINLNKDTIIETVNSDKNILAETVLYLGKNYKIHDKLYIDFIDLQYKSVDKFIAHRPIEPLGEFKFIVNF